MEIPTIENWAIHANLRKRGEKLRPILVGSLGSDRIVQHIVSFDVSTESIVLNNNLKVLLGNPKKEYERVYPNAKDTLLSKLRDISCKRERKKYVSIS